MSPDQGPQLPAQPRDEGQPGRPPARSSAEPTSDQAVAKTKVAPTTVVGRVVGGLGLLVVLPLSLLPYYHADASFMGYSDTRSTNAWDSWVSILGIVLVMLGCLGVVAAASGRLTGRNRNLALVGGAVASTTALPFFLSSMSSWPDYSDWKDAVSATGVQLSQARDVGFFLVLLFAVVIVGLSWALVGTSWHDREKTEDDSPVPAGSGRDSRLLAAPEPGRGTSPAPPETFRQQHPDRQHHPDRQEPPTTDG